MMPAVTKGFAGKCLAQQLRIIMIARDAKHRTATGGKFLFDPGIAVRVIVHHIAREQHDIHLGR